MPYLNIDDGEDEHPKVEGLSDAAFRLWCHSRTYSARNLTDGIVTLGKARRLSHTGNDVVAAEIVASGLWHPLGEGCDDPKSIEARTCRAEGVRGAYMLHDWFQWNHSKEWWENRRREEADRKRKYRARKNGGATDAA